MSKESVFLFRNLKITPRSFFYKSLMGVMCLFTISCEYRDEQAIQALIREQVANNVNEFRKKRFSHCYKEAMEKAIAIADSIMLDNAMLEKENSRFERPVRPSKPPIIISKDKTPIEPLFITQDTTDK